MMGIGLTISGIAAVNLFSKSVIKQNGAAVFRNEAL